MKTVRLPPSAHQLTLLEVIVDESGRRSSVQLPGVLVHREDGHPPLAALLRLGEPATKLYLTLVLATRKPPHDLYRGTSAARFARMLGFDDAANDAPASSGTRKIQRAVVSLDGCDIKFITRLKRPGRVDHVTVNHFTGDLKPPYVTLPLTLWRKGWINVLSARALVVYIALRHACAGGEGKEFYIAPYKREGYGLSEDTWKRGTDELKTLGLLTITQGSPQDRDIRRRRRNLYQLDSATMNDRYAGLSSSPSGA